jgi:hypothetical protein
MRAFAAISESVKPLLEIRLDILWLTMVMQEPQWDAHGCAYLQSHVKRDLPMTFRHEPNGLFPTSLN